MKNLKFENMVIRYGRGKIDAFVSEIKRLENDSEKVARAYEVFGRAGTDVLAALT